MKKLVCCVFALLMMMAAYAETKGNFTYEIAEDGTAVITKYTGKASNLNIPDSLDGYRVR